MEKAVVLLSRRSLVSSCDGRGEGGLSAEERCVGLYWDGGDGGKCGVEIRLRLH